MLPILAASVVVTFCVGLALWWAEVATPAAVAHVVFAVGIMPLIVGAMSRFIVRRRPRGAVPSPLRGMPREGLGKLTVGSIPPELPARLQATTAGAWLWGIFSSLGAQR